MDKLLSGEKFSRDHSPLSGMRGIFHRGENNQNKTRSKETETEKTSGKMRVGEMDGFAQPSERDRAPCVREGEREWRDGERRQAHGMAKHGKPQSSAERTQAEKVGKKGKQYSDTVPRVGKGDRDHGRRMMGEEGGERRQRDRPRRETIDDWEMERWRHQVKERVEIKSTANEERRPPEDIRTQKRERYKVSGVEFQERAADLWDSRARDAGRTCETLRPVKDIREYRRYSPQRTPEREVHSERRERTPRRDARSEGDVDEKKSERRERMRDRDREEGIPFSRGEEFHKRRTPRDRDQDGYQEKCREERYKTREMDDRRRDGRTEVKSVEREKEGLGEIGSDGRRDDDRYRNERRDRERKKRHEDGRAGRGNRSMSDSFPQVPPRAQRSRERSSEGDGKIRYKKDFEREQRKEGSVTKVLQIDPGQAGEKSEMQLARNETLGRDEITPCASDKTQMWLEPHRGKTQPRYKDGRRVDERDIKSQTGGERDVRLLHEDQDERNKTQSKRQLERRDNSEDSEVDEDEIWREQQSDSGERTEERWRREHLLNNTRESGTEEEDASDSGSRGGSDGSVGDEREQKSRNREKLSKLENSNKRVEESRAGKEEVINVEQQGRVQKSFGVVGQTSSRSESSELSLSQDEDMGGAETVAHHERGHVDKCKPQHNLPPTPSRRNMQPLIDSQGTGNGYSAQMGEYLNSEDPAEGDVGYVTLVDLQDIEVEEIMRNDSQPTNMWGKKRDSKTERLIAEWREKNQRKGDRSPTNSRADLSPRGSLEKIESFLQEIDAQAMSPEEVEALRIELGRTWSDSEATKRYSKPPHIKWAKSVCREILGHSGESEDPYMEVAENQSVKQAEDNKHQEEAACKRLPALTLTTDDHLSETEQEEEEEEDDFDYKDDNDIRSKSLGEGELRNALKGCRLTRKSSFYNRPPLYQQYNEESQNFEILRQSRSDSISPCEGNSRSPLASPIPARRPLPPLPSVPHPHSLSHTGSLSTAQTTLSVPEHPRCERRASSPSLTLSLTQSALWRDLPSVRNTPELEKLSEDQRRLQEVRFEVVTSEASYCRSLDIVVEHFVKSSELDKLLTTQDKNWLFSRLTEVRAISRRFLTKLEERMELDVLHFTVCDIIAQHCPRFKKVYVPYLTNQSYQDATYQRLMNENPNFKRFVDNLERSTVCQRLPLRSFLVLPFQRITRIKLLVQNILKRTTPGTVEAENTIKALRRLEKIIQESNDSITQMKSIESLVSLSGRVEFVDCKTLPLISQKRRLIREGPVTELMDFSLKQSERTIYLHLFNDYLLVSLQKEGGRFTVIDHCPVEELRTEDFRVKLQTLQKNSFRLHMSQRSLLLRTETQSDKLRWLSALSRTQPAVDFSAWESSAQMQCIRAYVAQQPDELSMEKADVILVHQDSADNWVQGTRLPDLHFGWVPKSHLKAISNDAVKKRNLSDALTLTQATAAV
uniref:Uncharacterized LOC105934939 n=1 Tax=Fundulus heteroclitus TaxID=8078 RepID=A0A3Q2PK04_FUNHE